MSAMEEQRRGNERGGEGLRGVGCRRSNHGFNAVHVMTPLLRIVMISMWMSNMVQKSDNGSDAVGEAGLRVHANSIDDASFATTLTY